MEPAELETATARVLMESPELAASVKPNGKPARAPFDVVATSAYDLWEANVPEPEAIIHGCVFRNQLGILAGRPKAGKSIWATQAAIAVARGGKAFGSLDVRQCGRVLYAALEDTHGTMKKRLHRLCESREIHLQDLAIIRRLPTLREGAVELLDGMLTERPAVLVIIDTWAKLLRADRGRDLVRADYDEVDAIRRLAEKHRCGVLLIYHTRKMEAAYGLDAVQGTSGTTAAADYVLILKRDGRGGHMLSVTGRDVESHDYAMHFADGCWNLSGTFQDVERSASHLEVLNLFRGEGVGATLRVEQIAHLTGRPLPATHTLVCRMCKEGLLDRVKRGEYQATHPIL